MRDEVAVVRALARRGLVIIVDVEKQFLSMMYRQVKILFFVLRHY